MSNVHAYFVWRRFMVGVIDLHVDQGILMLGPFNLGWYGEVFKPRSAWWLDRPLFGGSLRLSWSFRRFVFGFNWSSGPQLFFGPAAIGWCRW